MKKELISERDLKSLLGLIMIVVAGIAYFLGFKVFLESASEIKSENAELQIRLNDLQEKDRNKKSIIKQTEEYDGKINEIVMNYPSKVTPEKVFYDMYNMDMKLGKTHFTSVVAEMNGLFYPEGNVDPSSSTESATEETAQTEKQGFTSDGVVTAYKTQVTTQLKDMSYKSLKDMVKEVKLYDGRMSLDSLNLNFSRESGLLEGTVVYEMYALEGSPKEYVVPDIRMASGVKNIFGTFDAN